MKPLSQNAIVDIIAPAGKVFLPAAFSSIENLLQQWGYQARVGKHLLGNHPFLSNTVENRFEDLKHALYADDSEAVWCYRGGSGAAELLPLLDKLTPPKKQKIFLGLSDITSLHIFLNQKWGWTTFHGPCARQTAVNEIDEASLLSVKNLFEGKIENNYKDKITGGNLTVISHLLGTPYQINTDNKILLLEDINEPAYKIRRMLTQLSQAGIFNNIKALLLGEFILASEKELIDSELAAFTKQQSFPVIRVDNIGHGKKNIVIPLN